MTRTLSLGLALTAVFSAACASNPKTLNPSTDVRDGASTAAAAPVAATPAPAADTAAKDSAPACGLVRVAFAFDSAQLTEPAMQSLREDAKCLSQRSASALLIEGHCDERGTTEYNIALGSRRAEAVKRYLNDLGVKTHFETVSFGKELPLVAGSSESAWSQNRRAELRLPGEKRSDGKTVSSN